MCIRQATKQDVSRIAEIYVFNNRINFYPIFQCDEYSFGELQVLTVANEYLLDENLLQNTFVYDDGVVRGFICIAEDQVKRLFVDPCFQNRGIGAELFEFAIRKYDVMHLWALEKNVKAIRFYERYGFRKTEEKTFEEGTTEYLVKMVRQ